MTADDLTRLRDEFNQILANHGLRLSYRTQIVSCWGCDWDADYGLGVASDVIHRAHVASVLASSPTVAALIDRVERAERERDRLLDCEARTSWGQCAATSLLTEGADDGQ